MCLLIQRHSMDSSHFKSIGKIKDFSAESNLFTEAIVKSYCQKNLEAQLFLTDNRSFWNRESVQKMLNGENK